MAKRRAIADDIRSKYGDSLTAKEVLSYLGVDFKTGKRFLSTIDHFTVTDGGHPRYLAIDVAAAIDRRQCVAATATNRI